MREKLVRVGGDVIIGVTGSFASGKTTVSNMFKGLGAYVIDADKICHCLMLPSNKVYKKIIRHFGASILKKNRSIDRKKLAEIVFNKRPELNLLNKIVHPAAMRRIKRIIRSKKKRNFIIVDAALLLETGLYKDMDKIIVVRLKRTEQLKRARKAKGMSRKQILQRIRMQAPIQKKLAHADFIIDNSAAKKKTFIQVSRIWKTIRRGL